MTFIPAIALVLHIHNLAGAPPAVVSGGGAELTRAYPRLAIAFDEDCDRADRASDVIRVVVLREAGGALRRGEEPAMGAAVRTAGGARVVYVFFDRVRAEAERHGVSTALVLACVIEHELGHLLLTGAAHSRDGLMQRIWRAEDFRSANRGQLRFSPDELALLESGSVRRRESEVGHVIGGPAPR